ncbi:phage tail tape measure protein [Brevibacillus porteri]|uniref:Phage tail tape measure protein n=1 Tax=Brevibacillus porteri TaxID=2126350 RepID=A0ABX5FHR1_9BACL|nr:phage tail tape measure protein [Brevibacillus porteri]MED1801779.1 phage tail tape measure protein [Brevibacillus porteri]MED2134910.1 phage tail tape measure protein [Brevibacillus porteri]MED2748417.1 phage tail tape measure protein [Brevibacillus porteri]MED2818341.1 phage tail tape measure protein [Brevibacillus porteri]MED2897700.1 phage tail tape measure protein [Brevibacillus porteri]
MGVISNLMFAVGFQVSDRGLQDAQNQVEETKAAVIGLGIAAGVALAGFGLAAVNAASQFEQAMSQVQMATGATNDQMIATKEFAKELYAQNFGEDWNDLGNAISAVQTVTGQAGNELKETTKNALLMRDAFQYDVNESVKTADTMMKQFGITSEQAYNLLAQGAQKGLDKSGDLLDTANEYSGYFSKLGFSANEMFDIFSSGMEAGAFNLDKVGDGIKEFGIRTKDGSKTSMDAYKSIGLNGEEMTKKFATGGKVAQEAFLKTVKAINEVKDPVQRNAASVALFGTQAEDLEERVIKAYGNVKKTFDMTKNTMEQINQVKIDSPGQALALIGRQIETGLLIPIGQFLLPIFMEASKGIGFFIQHIDVFGPAIGGVAAVILGALVPSMWASAVAGWAMMAPFLPLIAIALLVGAAIAGVILIFKNWGTIGPWLAQKWQAFKTWTVNIFNSIVQFFKTWGSTILVILGGPVVWVAALIYKYWDQIKAFTVAIFVGIWNYLTSTWNNIIATVTNAGTTIWMKIQSTWNQVTGFLSGINLFEIGRNIIQGMIDGIGSMATALMDKMKAIGDGITDKIKAILGIHSPSRVMMEVGYFTGEGLAQGIENTQARVAAASTGLADDVTTPHSYDTPAAKLPPATVAGASPGATGGTMKMEIVIKLDVTGGADAKQTGTAIATELKPTLQEIIQSAARRLGVSLVVEQA